MSRLLSAIVDPRSVRSSNGKVRAGFTLIELLVVIAIIGILTALLVANFSTARAKARDGDRLAKVSQIRTATEAYIDDTGASPSNTAALVTANWLLSNPTLPDSSTLYGFCKEGTTGYQVWAVLERINLTALGADQDIAGATYNDACNAGYTAGVTHTDATSGSGACAATNCTYDFGR